MTEGLSYIQKEDKQIFRKPATKTDRQRFIQTDRGTIAQTDIKTGGQTSIVLALNKRAFSKSRTQSVI